MYKRDGERNEVESNKVDNFASKNWTWYWYYSTNGGKKNGATSRECWANFGFSRDLWHHFCPTSTCCNLEQPDFRRFRSSTSNTLFQNPLTDLPSIIYIILVFIFFRQYKFINLIPYITDLTPSPTSPWKAGSQVCKLYISRHWRGVLCPIN